MEDGSKQQLSQKPVERVGFALESSHPAQHCPQSQLLAMCETMHSTSINMKDLNCKALQIVEEPTDAEALSSFSSLDMDVVSIIVEFLDPQSMIRLASTSRFSREMPLSYHTVIHNSVLNKHDSGIWNRIYRLLQWDKEVQNIDLPSRLCLLRIINITRCERCNKNAQGLTFYLLFCDNCGEDVMGSELYEFHNPTEEKFWSELSDYFNSDDRENFVFSRPQYTWDMFLEFHPREGIHSVDAAAVAILRQVWNEAVEVSCMRVSRIMKQYLQELEDNQFETD